MVTKYCPHCKQVKPVSEFGKCRGRKDGHHGHCKICRQQYYQKHKPEIQQYRQEHKAKLRQYQKLYRLTLPGYLRIVWQNILQRCNNPKYKQFKDYGGRGIQVKIPNFEAFYDYVVNVLKVDPRGLTIDRINNNGHYELGNIRFVTRAENNRNKRKKGA